MSYTRTYWQDGKTPLNADNLNKLEEGVIDAHNANQNIHELHVALSKKVRSWGPVFNPNTGHVVMTPVVEGFNK